MRDEDVVDEVGVVHEERVGTGDAEADHVAVAGQPFEQTERVRSERAKGGEPR